MGPGVVFRRIFSIAGFSLSFGLLRMETILRVAWLPVTLLLVLDMATVFTILSIAAGQPLSFSDYATYVDAVRELQMYGGLAWSNDPNAMLWISGGALVLQWILVSSFMAPLIRYAGLGERPSPGAVKLPFGLDQIRFMVGYVLSFLVLPLLLIAPIAVSAPYVVKAVHEVTKVWYASFPDPDSLHTVTFIPASQILSEKGELWYYLQGVPLGAAAPFALLLWFVLFRHFRPRSTPRNPILEGVARAFGTLIVGAGVSLLLAFKYVGAIVVGLVPMLSTFFAGVTMEAGGALMTHMLAALPVIIALIGYGNLRALPYSGVAVSRRSFSLAGTGRVTRGWKLVWVVIAIAAILTLVGVAQWGLNFCLGLLGSSLNTLLFATESATRLAGGGETGEWVFPTFVTVWNIVRILANMLWVFFTYGVFAGLLGRLYRESEIEEA